MRRSGFSASGPEREHNEDAFALPLPWADERRLGTLLVVADGVGGAAGGAEASAEAVHALQALYYARTGAEDPGERLRTCVEAVNAINRLRPRSTQERMERLTTLAAAVVREDQIWVANVGDSRAYLIQAKNRDCRALSEAHNEQTRQAKVNSFDPRKREVEDLSGVIYRAIGLADRCQVDLYHYTWAPGDRLLLCTDGMAGLPEDEMIATCLDTVPREAAARLVEQALEADGSDNCTAVVAAWLETESEADSEVEAEEQESARKSEPEMSDLARLLHTDWAILAVGLGLLLGWLTAAFVYIWLASQVWPKMF